MTRRQIPLHEIIETERRYPGLWDDVLTHLGYRAFMKRQTETDTDNA